MTALMERRHMGKPAMTAARWSDAAGRYQSGISEKCLLLPSCACMQYNMMYFFLCNLRAITKRSLSFSASPNDATTPTHRWSEMQFDGSRFQVPLRHSNSKQITVLVLVSKWMPAGELRNEECNDYRKANAESTQLSSRKPLGSTLC